MNKLSIAFLSRDLPEDHPNGVSWQVNLLANELSLRGHRVTVFSMDTKPAEALYNVVSHKSGSRKGKLRRLFIPAYFFSRQNFSEFDIIHAHGDNYLLHTNKPVVRTFYGSALWESIYDNRTAYRIRQAIFYPLEWIMAMRSTVNVGISQATGKAVPFVKTIIPCGVDTEKFKPGNKKFSEPSILFIGNLSGRKRGWQLVDAFLKHVVPAFPTAKLHIVTQEAITAKPNIIIHKKISSTDLQNLLRQVWIVCITSTYEGFGVPALEAFACGTAVISTRNAGAVEIIQNNDNGVLCEISEIGIWINRLLADGKLRKRLSKAGAESAQKYSIQNIEKEYELIYEKLLSQ